MTSENISTIILSKVDIVDVLKDYIDLEKAGDNYKAVCPFHNDRDPSLSVSPKLQIYRCFGLSCGVGGNAASFISLWDNIPYSEALVKLAKRIGRPDLAPKIEVLEYKDVFSINKQVLDIYRNVLYEQKQLSRNAIDYLRSRGIKKETAQHFSLGYAPNPWSFLVDSPGLDNSLLEQAGLIKTSVGGNRTDYFKNRIIFPIYVNGNLLGFTGRFLGTSRKIAKYKNSSDSDWFKKGEILWPWDLMKNEIRSTKELILVEGQFDVVQLFQRGIKNVIAVSGSYLSNKQIRFISSLVKNVIIVADGDLAGIKNTVRISEQLLKHDIEIKIIYVDGKDPDDLARSKNFNWEELNETCLDPVTFCYNYSSIQPNKKLENSLLLIAHISNKIQKASSLQLLSQLSGYDEEKLNYWVKDYEQSTISNQSVRKTIKLSLEEEYILLNTSHPGFKVSDYLLDKFDKEMSKDLINLSSIQELTKDVNYVNRLLILENMNDIGNYADDLFKKLTLQYKNNDLKNLKLKLKETGDLTILQEIEKLNREIKRIKNV